MSLTSSLSMAVSASQAVAADLGSASRVASVRRAVALAAGTGAGAADLVFSDRRTIAASGTENLDLAGTLVDSFGATITFVKVKGIYIAASAANTNSVVVGAAGTNPWIGLLNTTGTVTLRPGAALMAMAGQSDATGMGVVAATGDLLKVANSGSGTGVDYDVVIIGTSA
jgi:hypothetical protein